MATESKASILDKMSTKLKQLTLELDEANKKIAVLLKENKELRVKKTITLEDEDTLKFMLEEKAKNKTTGMIKRELLIKFNIDYNSQDIQDRIGNIQDLSIDLQKFYYEKVKANNKNREIIDEIERKNDVDRFNTLYDKLDLVLMTLDEDNEDHRGTILATTEKMTQLIDRKNKINKDVIGGNDKSGFKDDVDKVMENYNNTKVVSFKAVKRQVD